MEAELRCTLSAAAARARVERGNLEFDLQQDINNPAVFASFERWQSQSDLEGHLRQRYMQDFQARASLLLAAPPQLRTYNDASNTDSPAAQEQRSMDVAVQPPTLREFLARTLAAAQAVQHGTEACRAREIPLDAFGDKHGREEVFVRYTVGKGRFAKWHDPAKGRAEVLLSALTCRMYELDRTRDGTFKGRWYPQITPDKMMETPTQTHSRPFDNPVGPFVETGVGAWTEAEWKFSDGSSIIGTGPASLQLVKFNEGDGLFLVSVAGIIANGTGKYTNARGVKTALGATYVPPGTDLFHLPPNTQFDAVTVETFRVVLADDITPPSGGAPPQRRKRQVGTGADVAEAASQDLGGDE
jgi:quinol monooxygenase YgiN